MTTITIDVRMLGSEWTEEDDDIDRFAEILGSELGCRVVVASSGDSSVVPDAVWNRALDMYAEERAEEVEMCRCGCGCDERLWSTELCGGHCLAELVEE